MVDFQVISGQPLFIVNASGFHLYALPPVFSPEILFLRWKMELYKICHPNPQIVIGLFGPPYPELRFKAASLKLTAE